MSYKLPLTDKQILRICERHKPSKITLLQKEIDSLLNQIKHNKNLLATAEGYMWNEEAKSLYKKRKYEIIGNYITTTDNYKELVKWFKKLRRNR